MDRVALILLGVDFGSASLAACHQASRIAAWSRATVHTVHVTQPLALLTADPMIGLPPMADLIGDPLGDARAAWSRFATDVTDRAPWQFDARLGSPAYELPRLAKELNADLVVLGTSSGAKGERGVGPTASAVVRRSGKRTLLVQPEQHGPFTRILACIDFSPTSLLALESAARLASQDSARLHVLHVFDPPWRRTGVGPTNPLRSPDFRDRYRAALTQHLETFCQPLRHELTYLKPAYELAEHESHGRGIALHAGEVGADLVVLGTRGKTTARDLVIGSTAERVLRHTHCSVLAVPPEP